MIVFAYHGTDRLDFTRFDIAQTGIYNIGLHFGTKAAALSRIEHLRENGRGTRLACPQFRVLTCELALGARQVVVAGEEMVKCKSRSRCAA